MNTRLIMTSCALIFGITGILLTFAPELGAAVLEIPSNRPSIFSMQLLGALYFGFAMLNWMSKGSPIGGIYNRPVAVANFTHFMIGGLALFKGIITNIQLSVILWLAAGVYILFGGLFAYILFKSPK